MNPLLESLWVMYPNEHAGDGDSAPKCYEARWIRTPEGVIGACLVMNGNNT